jgi:signal transduction histidine kinase
MRNIAEVTLRRDVVTYEHRVRKMLGNIERMTLTVERLLQLSRLEAIEIVQHYGGTVVTSSEGQNKGSAFEITFSVHAT